MILGPEESIFDNLRYGIKKSPATDWEEIEERSRKIMKRLGFRETLLKYHFKENQFVGVGGARSVTPFSSIHLTSIQLKI